MSIKIADVGPVVATCYTGQNKVLENFVYVWTIADFKNKMKRCKLGELIKSDVFHIGDTKWYIGLYPAGYHENSKGFVVVCLWQESKKDITVIYEFFTGKKKNGEFIIVSDQVTKKFEEGHRSVRPIILCSHQKINMISQILRDGSLELISRISVKGAVATITTSDEVNKKEREKIERFKVGDDFEKMLHAGEETDFEVWCEGDVIRCH